jgi:hypothetical protein
MSASRAVSPFRFALVAIAFALLAVAPVARAQVPTADQLLSDIGLSDSDKQQVLGGQFVTVDMKTVSDRDLSVGIAFVVKASPDSLVKQVEAGSLLKVDPQVKQSGRFKGAGSAADIASLTINAADAKTLGSASAGSSLNFSTAEIAALDAAGANGQPAVQQALQQLMLARFQAYKASGLGGIATYDRGGSQSDVAADLRKAAEATANLKKYLPALQQLLLNYPSGSVAGLTEIQQWIKYDIDGVTTFVLGHSLIVPSGDARVAVSRQYYASTGYNGGQAIVAFLPVAEGTVVLYSNHTFTDQVAGWGGSAKRGIGRGIMTKKLEEMFRRQKSVAEK